MATNKLPDKYVLTISMVTDEEPEEIVANRKYPHLSWALKELSHRFEDDLKEFKSRAGYFPETRELVRENLVQLSYETSAFRYRYYTVKPL